MSKPCRTPRLCITFITLGINFLGGLLTFLYLIHIGLLFHERDFQLIEQLFFSGVISLATIGEVGHGVALSAVYRSYQSLKTGGKAKISRFVQLRAINLPAIVSLGSFTLWLLAALVFGGILILWNVGDSPLYLFSQIFLSVGIVSGGTTSILIYFIIERYWQPFIPAFFPDGDMSVVPSVRPSIFQRLFVLFVLGIMPLLVMAGLTYDLAAQGMPVQNQLAELRKIYVFVVGVSFLVALFLAFSVGMSLINFSKELLDAMFKVSQGDLDTPLQVTTSDEFGELARGFNAMLDGLRREELIHHLFERYVGSEVATRLIQEQERIAPELVEATILFVDIRDFTHLTESLSPERLLKILNRFLGEMSQVVSANRGLVHKFIGDSIMAIYGTPLNASENSAQEAVATAKAMLAKVERLNRIHQQEGLPALKIGIGIASGKIVAGTLGQGERVEYTFIGDAVNLASRLEGLTKERPIPILLDVNTARLLTPESYLEVGDIRVRGKEKPIAVFMPKLEES